MSKKLRMDVYTGSSGPIFRNVEFASVASAKAWMEARLLNGRPKGYTVSWSDKTFNGFYVATVHNTRKREVHTAAFKKVGTK